jgi:hypothetical protein
MRGGFEPLNTLPGRILLKSSEKIYYQADMRADGSMIEKIVKKKKLQDLLEDDLDYWLSKSPEERIQALELLRKQYNGNSAGLQRVARVVQYEQR